MGWGRERETLNAVTHHPTLFTFIASSDKDTCSSNLLLGRFGTFWDLLGPNKEFSDSFRLQYTLILQTALTSFAWLIIEWIRKMTLLDLCLKLELELKLSWIEIRNLKLVDIRKLTPFDLCPAYLHPSFFCRHLLNWVYKDVSGWLFWCNGSEYLSMDIWVNCNSAFSEFPPLPLHLSSWCARTTCSSSRSPATVKNAKMQECAYYCKAKMQKHAHWPSDLCHRLKLIFPLHSNSASENTMFSHVWE